MNAPEAPRPDPHRFVVLDSWRGIAALAVALHHLDGSAPFFASTLHGELSRAVDFFFVLSGFVIATSYGQRLAHGFPFTRFMMLRIGRIWPLHAALVLVYLALEMGLWLHGGGSGGDRAPFTGPRDLATLVPALLLLQAWIWPGRDLWNVQSWSVSVELGLYVGAALLWRLAGPRANLVGLALALTALTVLAGSAGLSDQVLRGIAGFGLGMACRTAWPWVEALVIPSFAAAILELLLVGAVIFALATGQSVVLDDGLFAVMILLFGREQGPLSRLLRTAPARWLGVLSYALYMVHGLVFGRIFDLLGAVQTRLGGQWVSSHLGGGDQLLLPPLPAALVVAATLSRRLAARIGAT